MTRRTQRLARLETPLKRVLDEEGRRQSWLAERIGATPDQVNRWVHGVHEPVDQTKVAIARVLGRDVAELWPPVDGASALDEAA